MEKIEKQCKGRYIQDIFLYLDKKGRILENPRPDGAKHPLLERKGGKIEHLKELIPEEYRESVVKSMKRAIKEGETYSESIYLEDGDEQYCFEIIFVPMGSSGKKRLLVIVRDVSAEKRSSDYLNVIKKIFEDATEGILITSYNSDFFEVNEAFCKMCGMEKERLPGRKLVDYAQFFDERTFEKIKESVNRKGKFRGEVTLKRADGEDLDVWLTIDTVYDEEKRAIYRVSMLTDISGLHKSRDQLYFTATHDALTGLPNRRMLFENLELILKRALRNGRSGAVFFIDLDNFKNINDMLGHEAGDKVLVECSRRIQSIIRQNDIFGRLGGDEFLLIVEDVDSADTLMYMARRILKTISRPITLEDFEYEIEASIGIAVFPRDGETKEEILRRADAAMYEAKENGKNNFTFYSAKLEHDIKRHYIVEKALKKALKKGGLRLLFQPRLDIAQKRIEAFEALIRIDPSIAGDIEPKELILVAEKSGLINRIGKWVLKESCETLKEWKNDEAFRNISIAINLSRRELLDEAWVDLVKGHLSKYGIDPDFLEFEIAETTFMQLEKNEFEAISELQRVGCSFSIDDFGTGCSTLSNLKRFPVDSIKIDNSFIQNIMMEKSDFAIVKAAVALADAMQINTIAEAVETREQAAILKKLGCRQMQGFLLSYPLSASEAFEYMHNALWREKIEKIF